MIKKMIRKTRQFTYKSAYNVDKTAQNCYKR